MKIIKYILGVSLGLLALIILEAMFTVGDAFNFTKYSTIGIIFQVLAVIATISFSITATHAVIENKKLS